MSILLNFFGGESPNNITLRIEFSFQCLFYCTCLVSPNITLGIEVSFLREFLTFIRGDVHAHDDCMSGTPYGNPLVEDEREFFIDLAVDTPTSASQTFVSEDGIPNERARVLGGGSSLNAGFFSYASPDYVRSVGWNSTLVNESYAWVTPMVAALPELQTFQRAARAGLLEVGVVPDNGRTFQHLIGTNVGGSSFDSSGRRHTAADILRYADPDRITVLLWANTQRVLFTESKSYRCLSSRMN